MGKKTETVKKTVGSEAVVAAAATPAPTPAATPVAKPVIKADAKPAAGKTAAAAAKPKKAAAAKKSAAKPVISVEAIQLRAYFISEARQKAGIPGDSHQDWVKAERELLAELKPKKSKAKKA